MRYKISKALRLLLAGREISIKGFSQMIERVICMTEIIKDRIGKPLFQHTTFLRDKVPSEGKESQDQEEPKLNVYRCGIFVKLSTLDIFDRQEIGYQEHVPGSVDLQSKKQ
jgi:hypothetical protein